MAISAVDNARQGEGEGALPKPEPHVLVLFGATGDLARRKLLPGLFHLDREGLMPDAYRIVGTSLSELDDEKFREHVRGALEEFCRAEITDDEWQSFSELLTYVPSKADALAAGVASAEEAIGGEPRRLYYLSVPPSAAGPIVRTLGEAGLAARARVVME
jgi:glucose-6-phosphate 1-dehydrogenase